MNDRRASGAGKGAATEGAHVALLRGINLGGKNKLPMAGLVELFSEAGCRDVVTYIQSGNVVYRASEAVARLVPRRIPQAIAEQYGLRVPVVTRTASELARLARTNPFLLAGANAETLHVAFLADRPAAARVARLDPHRSTPDEFRVRGCEVYLCCPNGFGRTKLTNEWFDTQLRTTSTVRNWRTVLRLVELSGG